MSGIRQQRWFRWRGQMAVGGRWLAAVMIAGFGATVLVASVAAASAATPGGVLYAFGANDSGELGSAGNVGTANTNPTPTPVTLPAGAGAVTEIAAGASPQGTGYSLAVSASGSLYAFGDNQYGELGIATSSGSGVSSPTPTVVTLPEQDGAVTQVAAGGGYSLVLTATGQLYGFGNNDSGELGSTSNNGTFNANPTPTLVGLPGQDGAVTQIAAGYDHSLVVTSSGQLYAFGYNGDGDLGNTINDGADVANPTPTLVSLPGQVGPVTHVAAGGFQSLVVTASGQLYAFGQNEYGELGLAANSGTYGANSTPTLVTLPGATGTVAQIATGYSHSLVVTSTGQLYAFGDNHYGQLGNDTDNGSDTANPTPTQVTLPGQDGAITQIAAGYADSLAVTAGGQLYAFGDNDDGQLGNDTDSGSNTANPTPTPVSFPTGMTVDSVAAGPVASHTLAIVSGPATVPAPAPAPPAAAVAAAPAAAPAAAAAPPAVPHPPAISPPLLSHRSLSGLTTGRTGKPKLKFTATHGANAADISVITIGLPRGLSFSSKGIVTQRACHHAGHHKTCKTTVSYEGLAVSGGTVAAVKIGGATLVITLKKPVAGVTVTVAGRILAESRTLYTRIKQHKTRSLTISVKVTDANHTSFTLALRHLKA